MGVTGLLGLLKSIQKPCNLKAFAGQTLGVDGYGWLHRGLISCSTALALDRPTRKYVDFALNRVRMLIHFGVIPYIVLDGNYLPSKAMTETSRAARREAAKKLGLELLRQGRSAQAQVELQKAVDLTPEMAKLFIEELKKMNVKYVVAPYEADSQLVYLEKKGLIKGIISEDSDLLVFGAQQLITKLDQYGNAISLARSDFGAVTDVSLAGWTDVEFRTMAIMSGCDYLKNIPGLGLKKSYALIRKHKTIDRIMKAIQMEGNYRVPTDYLASFREAEQAFLYQWVFCPLTQTMVNLTDPSHDPELDISSLSHVGSFIDDHISRGVAVGNLNPHTKEPLVAAAGGEGSGRRAQSSSNGSVAASQGGSALVKEDKDQRAISSFFQRSQAPLAERSASSSTAVTSLNVEFRSQSTNVTSARTQSESVVSTLIQKSGLTSVGSHRVASRVSVIGSSSNSARTFGTGQMADGKTFKRQRLSLDEGPAPLAGAKRETSKFFPASTPSRAVVAPTAMVGSPSVAEAKPSSALPQSVSISSLSAGRVESDPRLSRLDDEDDTFLPTPPSTCRDIPKGGDESPDLVDNDVPRGPQFGDAIEADISFLEESIGAYRRGATQSRCGSAGQSGAPTPSGSQTSTFLSTQLQKYRFSEGSNSRSGSAASFSASTSTLTSTGNSTTASSRTASRVQIPASDDDPEDRPSQDYTFSTSTPKFGSTHRSRSFASSNRSSSSFFPSTAGSAPGVPAAETTPVRPSASIVGSEDLLLVPNSDDDDEDDGVITPASSVFSSFMYSEPKKSAAQAVPLPTPTPSRTKRARVSVVGAVRRGSIR